MDREGTILYDPEEDQIFIEELKRNLDKPLDMEEVDCNLEDFDTAKTLVESLDHLMAKK